MLTRGQTHEKRRKRAYRSTTSPTRRAAAAPYSRAAGHNAVRLPQTGVGRALPELPFCHPFFVVGVALLLVGGLRRGQLQAAAHHPQGRRRSPGWAAATNGAPRPAVPPGRQRKSPLLVRNDSI